MADTCKHPDKHNDHVCQMVVNQRSGDIKKLRRDAMYFCAICDAATNNPDTVCSPRPYQGKSGILKWRA